MKYNLVSQFEPTIDQQNAIDNICNNISNGINFQTLYGLTGTGKTFIMANVMQKTGLPALVLTHNKTLVAQLYEEFSSFFPDNLVEYYVSHFDYFQPESYLPATNTYIEKDSSINDELNRLRINTAASLMSGRKDVCIVSSVSCIFGAGNPKHFKQRTVSIKKGDIKSMRVLLKQLADALYTRELNNDEFKRGTFIVKGDTLIVNTANDNVSYKIEYYGNEIENIYTIDTKTYKIINEIDNCNIYPASIIVMPDDSDIETILHKIEQDANIQYDYFINKGLDIEAKRIKERTLYDIEMIRELGYCNSMENYSSYFDGRKDGERSFTIMDYFDGEYIVFIDESHVSLPQIKAMYGGNKSRKDTLIEYGFRLPSSYNNRPLLYEEFIEILDKCVFVSATPSHIELELSDGLVTELLTRPTGILDPPIEIRSKEFQIDDLINEIHENIKLNHRILVTTTSIKLSESLTNYLHKIGIKCKYLHSEVQTLERTKILHELRAGSIDVIIGINLLREGLDLPEVGLVAILDADLEGFLRDYTSMMQTIGRAARNANGKAIMYADKITMSIKKCLDETKRRRVIQNDYNVKNNIVPKSIIKALPMLSITSGTIINNKKDLLLDLKNLSSQQLLKMSKSIKLKMLKASKEMDYDNAAMYKKQLIQIDEVIKII